MGTWEWPTGAGTAGASGHSIADGHYPPAGDCNKLVTLDLEPRKLPRQVLSGMEEHDLLTYASAIAFQVMTALIPIALLVLSVMGFLQLENVWTQDLAPQVKDQVSPQVFAVLDDVVRKTLGSKQGWWLTIGVVFTLWQASGVARAVMGALTSVYGGGDDRSFVRRYATSVALGLAVALFVIAALVDVRFGAPILGLDHLGWLAAAVVFLVRWGVALALLSTAVWVLLRFAPAHPGPHRWVSFGSGLCVMAWVGTSVVFGLYVTDVADYGSIFGSLATLFILMTYLYVSACAFLIGAQIDAIVRHDETGSRSGSPSASRRKPIVARSQG
jgi:membrane protein